MYIVKLSIKDGNNDYQFLEVEVNINAKNIAINKAIDYYYENFWTNTEWRKDDFEKEMKSFKSKIDSLCDGLLLKRLPNKQIIINEYESLLRQELGASDKSMKEFRLLPIEFKIDYLADIGCELKYFAYHKKYKRKFQKVSI